MAHHFENGSSRDDHSTGDRTPETATSGEGPQPQQSKLPRRSNPIAIVRNADDKSRESSDDEVDDNSTIDVELDALKIASSLRRSDAMSLPTHLLRAPRLGSVPAKRDVSWNQNNQHYPTMLPPAMNSSDRSLASSLKGGGGGDETAYGSLRDSHSRGKFLDGPSSYRDRQTGDIRQLQHRVRFQGNNGSVSVLASSLPAMSIGERIMNTRKKQIEVKEATSSLTALLEASSDKTTSMNDPDQEREEYVKPRPTTFYDEDVVNHLPHSMLSTSLTGLEILQAGLTVPQQFTKQAEARAWAESDDDNEHAHIVTNGHNTTFSRSFSDPIPGQLSSPIHTPVMSPMARMSISRSGSSIPSSNFASSPLTLSAAVSTTTSATTTTTTFTQTRTMSTTINGIMKPSSFQVRTGRQGENYGTIMYSNFQEHDSTSSAIGLPSAEENPDTDCGFDFEI